MFVAVQSNVKIHDVGSMKQGDYHYRDLSEVIRGAEGERGTKTDALLHINWR